LRREILITVDIEEWFQVENLKTIIAKNEWDNKESRVVFSTERILNLFDEYDIKATFFVLGWIAERFPKLVRKIRMGGHEIACHGFEHDLIYNIDIDFFKAKLMKAKEVIENCIGEKIYGYRAPSFSITDEAIEIIRKNGFNYDSSLFMFSAHDRYGKINKPLSYIAGNAGIFENGLMELSLPMLKIFRYNVPWAGGGYFRLIPYPLFKKGVNKILDDGKIFIFYIHPWEIDIEQPKLRNLDFLKKVRHYYNIEKTFTKLKNLCKDFRSVTICEKIRQLDQKVI